MRIAILQGAFLPVPPVRGGAVEKMWYLLGQEFAKHGHEVTHISRLVDGLPETEVIEGVWHERIPGYDTPKSLIVLKTLDLLYSVRVRGVFRKVFDVIVSNTFWAPLVLPKRTRQICMIDVARMPKGQMTLYRNVLRFRANSTPVAKAIKKELTGSKQDRVVMIPNPLPFLPDTDVDFLGKQPILLYVGRIHPEKGIDLLINAYKQIPQNYRLQLVGPWDVAAGGGGESYMHMLKGLAGDMSVEFIGPVYDPAALNEFYKRAALFVYPSVSEKGETFGLAPLEAMAWGCVPVVSSLACFSDFIQDGVNGRVFDHRSERAVEELATCLTALQADLDWQRLLGGRALGVRQTHSVEHIANLFLEEFKKMTQLQYKAYVS